MWGSTNNQWINNPFLFAERFCGNQAPKVFYHIPATTSWCWYLMHSCSHRCGKLRSHELLGICQIPSTPIWSGCDVCALSLVNHHFSDEFQNLKTTVDGSEIQLNQLRLVVYPIIDKVLAPSRVVVWDFLHQQYHWMNCFCWLRMSQLYISRLRFYGCLFCFFTFMLMELIPSVSAWWF